MNLSLGADTILPTFFRFFTFLSHGYYIEQLVGGWSGLEGRGVECNAAWVLVGGADRMSGGPAWDESNVAGVPECL